MTEIFEFTKEETEKLRALVSDKTFEYKYKNHIARVVRELTPEELADWKRRIDLVCR